MHYYTIQPNEQLKDVVSHFWVSNFDGASQDTFTYFSTADSCAKLVFIYKKQTGFSPLPAPELFSSGLQGQTQTYDQFPSQGGFEIFGINLFPYAIPSLFALPSLELSNQLVDLESLLGQKGKDLNEQMAGAAHPLQRLRIVTEFFENQLIRHYVKEVTITTAIQQIRRQQGQVDIRALSRQYCLSQKQFERKFSQWSGFTPKLYARIVRFEAVLNSCTALQSLTESGYACGYYDQSHFIRDFKEFTGYTPSRYFALIDV